MVVPAVTIPATSIAMSADQLDVFLAAVGEKLRVTRIVVVTAFDSTFLPSSSSSSSSSSSLSSSSSSTPSSSSSSSSTPSTPEEGSVIELPALRGGRTINGREIEWDNACPLFRKVRRDISSAFPTPLVDFVRLPSISFVTNAGVDQQPAAARNAVFLTALQRCQLAFVEEERIRADQFVAYNVATDEGGEANLSRWKLGDMRAYLREHGLESEGTKPKVVERLLDFAELSVMVGAGGVDAHLQRSAQLERWSRWTSSLKPDQWRRHAANAEFAKLQNEGFRKGFFRRCPEEGDKPVAFYDAYHLFHRMVLRILFGGGGGPGGILNQSNLRAAAEELGDPLLASLVYQKVDKNSHMATHYFLTHRGLARTLLLDPFLLGDYRGRQVRFRLFWCLLSLIFSFRRVGGGFGRGLQNFS